MTGSGNAKHIKGTDLFYISVLTLGILLFFIFFGGVFVTAISGTNEQSEVWAFSLAQILFMLLPTIWATAFFYEDWRQILRFKIPNIKIILIASAGILFIMIFTQGILQIQYFIIPDSLKTVYFETLSDYNDTINKFVGTGDTAAFLGKVIVIAMIPAFSEEFLFRGFLQTSFELKTKLSYSILFSAILFGIMHINPVIFVPLTVAGAYFGFVGSRTSSILMPVLLHFLNNLFGVISVFYFSNEINHQQLENADSIEAIIYTLIGAGGLSGICYYIYRKTKQIKTNLPIEKSEDG